MYTLVFNLLEKTALQNNAALIAYIIVLITMVVVSLLGRAVAKFLLVKFFTKVVKRTKYVWDDIFLKNKLFHRLADLVVPIAISLLGEGLPGEKALLGKIVGVIGILVFVLLTDSLLNSIDEIYRQYEISKVRPIRALLQVVKAVIIILCGIIAVAVLIGESPLVLLGGIGAMTAVTSFIFKDAILGFVAGIQLTVNDMIRIGDWIEMPGSNADGTVIELSMTTVKVENFDKSITSIPAYTLVSDAFINWRGMEVSGGRRIKRAIYIDAAGVRLCDDAMIDHFRSIALLRDYIDDKLAEIDAYNEAHDFDLSNPVNGRRITNIGTLRTYIVQYLKQHPGIHKERTMMVRQLAPTDRGIPLEIYAFTNTVDWVKYEGIQSDIFDHLYSVVSEFGLQLYQQPSGEDLRSVGRHENRNK